MDFETHITLDTQSLCGRWRNKLESIAKDFGWKTSNITDDPVLGPGDKFYLTGHYNDYVKAHEGVSNVMDEIERWFLPKVILRHKIELIMLDKRH